jgi:hypothetical protein
MRHEEGGLGYRKRGIEWRNIAVWKLKLRADFYITASMMEGLATGAYCNYGQKKEEAVNPIFYKIIESQSQHLYEK